MTRGRSGALGVHPAPNRPGLSLYEPAPHAVELLHRNVRENGYDRRIHVVPQAIDRAPGTASLHLNLTAHFLSSFYEAASRHPFEEGRYACVEVPCTSLDAWAERQQ